MKEDTKLINKMDVAYLIKIPRDDLRKIFKRASIKNINEKHFALVILQINYL